MPDSQLEYPKLQAQLDDIKSALYAVAEKVGKTTAETQQLSNEISKTNSQIRTLLLQNSGSAPQTGAPSTQGMDALIERSVSNAIDIKLFGQKPLESEVSLQGETTPSNAAPLYPRALKEMGESIETSLDKKLSLLAELESEILNRTNENLAAIKGIALEATPKGESRMMPVGSNEPEVARQPTYSQPPAATIDAVNSALAEIQAQMRETLQEMISAQNRAAPAQGLPEGFTEHLKAVEESLAKQEGVSEEIKSMEQTLAKLGLLQATFSGQLQEITTTNDKTLDKKLAALAELNAEILRAARESADSSTKAEKLLEQQITQTEVTVNSAAYISDKVKELAQKMQEQAASQEQERARMSSLIEQLDQAAKQSSEQGSKVIADAMAFAEEAYKGQTPTQEQFRSIRDSLSKIADNQNRQNEVYSDAFSSLLDATEKLSSQTESSAKEIQAAISLAQSIDAKISQLPDANVIAEQVEKEFSRKLG
jgi:hypothetical protein